MLLGRDLISKKRAKERVSQAEANGLRCPELWVLQEWRGHQRDFGTVEEVRVTPQDVREVRQGVRRSPILPAS